MFKLCYKRRFSSKKLLFLCYHTQSSTCKKYPVFTLEQQKTILENLDNSTYGLAVKIAFGTGLRLGELTALKWTDIDFEEGTLNVNKVLKQVNVVDNDGTRHAELLMQTPKTESSNRIVPIPSVLMKELKKHKSEQAIRIMRYRKTYKDEKFIFENGLGEPLEPRRLPRFFAKKLKELEIPM
ncbi:site-specific integrase [Miniphocaeibacter halophilus]|uniref:Site-specific integrase n=1 Tax=Miniphocaeibacter halophilus TaxID=2931922 RepID=A0AC61MQ57_9FIRM|nr:site-specific integrase [Miniphocaeibacter halophilus]QQK07731.1 site-specific integrase [Miniphocaeibacter halophilus]